jgi:hypothetical protein
VAAGAGANEVVRQGKAVDQPGALLLEVEHGRAAKAQLGLQEAGTTRIGMIGRDGVHHQHVDLVHGQARVGHGLAAGQRGQVGGRHLGRRVTALPHAGPLDDELVAGLHDLHQVEVRHHLRREVAAGAEDARSGCGCHLVQCTRPNGGPASPG